VSLVEDRDESSVAEIRVPRAVRFGVPDEVGVADDEVEVGVPADGPLPAENCVGVVLQDE
jgi:hypothetical protein